MGLGGCQMRSTGGWTINLDKIAKNCMKITESPFLGQNSEETKWGEANKFSRQWGDSLSPNTSGDPDAIPPSPTIGNPAKSMVDNHKTIGLFQFKYLKCFFMLFDGCLKVTSATKLFFAIK